MGKRKKVREVPLNATARSVLSQYLETLSQECQYLFPSGKTHRALTGRALGHLVTKYATQAQVADISPHDLRHRFGYRMAEVVSLHRLAQIMAYGKDSFLRQPYAPLKSQKPFLHPISPITYEKSFIWRADFFFFGFAFAFFWASEATKPTDFFFEVTTRIS
jgi:hypothetical protein